MVYRIRYRDRTARESEMAVEANSPNEAVVKFRHIRGGTSIGTQCRESVTSVSAEEFDEGPMVW